MSGRVIRWIGGIFAAAAVAAVAGYLAAVGLNKADKLASVIGALVGLTGWAVAVWGWALDRQIAEPGGATGATRGLVTCSGTVRVDDRPVSQKDVAPALPSRAVVPRQLPAAVAGFAGRRAQVRALTDQAAGAERTVVISAVTGTAGIGKTTLAVHWAHQVADRFPDGQLYVNLRGFDPAGAPMSPAEAIRGFLDAFEVPPERIPVSMDAQAALYRSLLVDRKMLIVLDNARDADQVRPLLPGSSGCAVLVTSRNRLISLIAAESARALPLDLLTTAEARQLLTHRLSAERVVAEPQAVEEIIELCARLPLALAIVAARAAALPDHPLSALAAELGDVHGATSGLEVFDGGDPATNVRAIFSWSYQQLTAPAARLFRLLGLHPGPDITIPAAAGLAGIPAGRARPALAELARAHMITEHASARFGFHDLLRAYATELTHTHDPEPQRHYAVRRMLDHYLHTVHAAALLLYPHTDPPSPTAPDPGVVPEQPTDYAAAWDLLTAEYPVLLAVIRLAADTGHTGHAWQFPALLEEFFRRGGHWHDWATANGIALAATERDADRHGQAHAHRGLGRAYTYLNRLDEVHGHLRHALLTFAELGDQIGEATIHSDLATELQYQGRPADALAEVQQALTICRTVGDRRSEARALNLIGWYQSLLGDHQQALTSCQRALALAQEFGDRQLTCKTLDSLGYAHHHLGHYARATDYFEQALSLAQELGDRWDQACYLTHLGDTHHARNDPTAARTAWANALTLLTELGPTLNGLAAGLGPAYADAEDLRAKLHHCPP